MQTLNLLALVMTLLAVGVHGFATWKVKTHKRPLYAISLVIVSLIALTYFLAGSRVLDTVASTIWLRSIGLSLMGCFAAWGLWDIIVWMGSKK